jgi:hypothetical protein
MFRLVATAIDCKMNPPGNVFFTKITFVGLTPVSFTHKE